MYCIMYVLCALMACSFCFALFAQLDRTRPTEILDIGRTTSSQRSIGKARFLEGALSADPMLRSAENVRICKVILGSPEFTMSSLRILRMDRRS